MINSKIKDLSVYLPERVLCNAEIETRVNQKAKLLPAGALEKLFGSRERRVAAGEEQASDLAAKAARPLLERNPDLKVDFLIFASACSDLIEPATANIVQYKLGLNCPAMDMKNACNSVVSAMMAADAMIKAGFYQNILVVSGEKPSDSVNFDVQDMAHLKRGIAALTLGDAGAAVLLSATEKEEGIIYQEFVTAGKHWELCTIKGGGSMFPHDASKNFFEGHTAQLKDVLIEETEQLFDQCLSKVGWTHDEVKYMFTHQVSATTFRVIAEAANLPPERCINVFDRYGNTASASIPLSLDHAISQGWLNPGDKIAIVGLAAGVSASVQLVIWG